MTDTEKPSCHLYQQTPMDRIRNELRELGKESGPVTVEELLNFDQMHYCGTESLDEAVKILGIKKGERVADVGCGFGGPARYLTKHYGTICVGFELLPDLVEGAVDLTKRTGITEDQLHFWCLNWLEYGKHQPSSFKEDFPSSPNFKPFDHLISILAILHIPDREIVFNNIFTALRPGGSCYIEDFFCEDNLSEERVNQLSSIVGCPHLPTKSDWISILEKSGFTDIIFTSVSEIWKPWVKQRSEDWKAKKERHTRVHGPQVFAMMDEFYATISDLFNSNSLHGVRLSFKRPEK